MLRARLFAARSARAALPVYPRAVLAGGTRKFSAKTEGRKKKTAKIAPFPGIADQTGFTPTLEFYPTAGQPFPCFSVLSENGEIVEGAEPADISQELGVKMYKCMVRLSVVDTILYDAQRQGRISFYMTNYGEEAAHIGSAAALSDDDHLFLQYREAGVLLWRGFTVQNMADQCASNVADPNKGRQMPVHYGSKKLNIQTISSPLATQIPQATGAGYALKRAGTGLAAVCYFGEGAASEGDFHAALNFAATLETPTVFFCRNNGYAISTPSSEQYRGDGIVVRGVAYGIRSVRVDGNDVMAVYSAMKEARRIAVEQSRPVLVEAMTYRGGHHSTSDDASRYRSSEELGFWQAENNPIDRFRLYLEKQGWWSDDEEEALRVEARQETLHALEASEKKLKPPVSDMFTDVYSGSTPALETQRAELKQHLEIHGDKYPLKDFVDSDL